MLSLLNKNYLLTILLSLLVLVTTAECKEVKKKTDLQKGNLKGKVKSVRHIKYKAIDKFGELTKGDIIVEYGFGNKLTKYDKNGNKIERNRYLPYRSLYMKETYKYDKNGNKIEANGYKSDGSLDWKYTYKYDKNGNKIEKNWYNSDGSLTTWKYTYKYDKNGNTIEYNRYSSYRSLYRKYNNKSTYKYKYDKHGNWVQKIYFEQKGENSLLLPQTIEERKIEYYK